MQSILNNALELLLQDNEVVHKKEESLCRTNKNTLIKQEKMELIVKLDQIEEKQKALNQKYH